MENKLNAAPTWIIVEPEEKEDKTSSGIYLATDNNEKPTTGIVVSVGKEIKQIKEGDKIMFKKWESNEVKWNGKVLLILKEESVLAIYGEEVN